MKTAMPNQSAVATMQPGTADLPKPGTWPLPQLLLPWQPQSPARAV